MYNKEQLLAKNMTDMALQVIPSKYTSGYNKLYPYTNEIGDKNYTPNYDAYDTNIVNSIYNWIKTTSWVERVELGLGLVTVNTPNVIQESNLVDNSYKIKLDGLFCDMNGNKTFNIPTGPDNANPDGIWMIIEFTPIAENPNIIFSCNVGNYQIDIAGGAGTTNFGEAHYDAADGNHKVILPMRAFMPDSGWIAVDHFGITIKRFNPGDIVKIENIRMYKIQVK